MINAIKEILQIVDGLNPDMQFVFWIFTIGIAGGLISIVYAVAELINSFAKSLRKKKKHEIIIDMKKNGDK